MEVSSVAGDERSVTGVEKRRGEEEVRGTGFFGESGGVFETTCSLRHDSDKNDVTGNLTVTYDIVTHSAPPLPLCICPFRLQFKSGRRSAETLISSLRSSLLPVKHKFDVTGPKKVKKKVKRGGEGKGDGSGEAGG